LPHFDTEYAARLVLGQYWRTTNQEQRKRFIDAFYHSLLTNYGSALIEFTPDQLKVFPTTVDPSIDHATVRTEVTGHNADRIDYQANPLASALTENEGIPLHLVHGAALFHQASPTCFQGGSQVGVREQRNVPVNLTQLVPQNEPAGFVDGLEGIVLAPAS
jgi:hypothetical protein